MNKKLEELAYIKFPDKPIWDGKYECDANWEARENWLNEAKEYYNLALEDIKEEIKKRMDSIIETFPNPSAGDMHILPELQGLMKFINVLIRC